MSIEPFIESNLEALEQGAELLRALDDATYRGDSAGNDGLPAIGPHFRHCIDFYDCFLAGLDRRDVGADIDYEARPRRRAVEQERLTALTALVDLKSQLQSSAAVRQDRRIQVKTEVGPSGSTIQRELEVLLSHTIHHYALIALTLKQRGHAVPEEFGVSLSTLAHWRAEGRCAR